MYTPRAKRRLYFTPGTGAKRARVPLRATPARTFTRQNRFTTPGVRRTGTLAQQVKALQTVVNKLKPETKYVDIDLVNANVPDATGAMVHLTAIAQGDTQSTRTGNSINVVNLSVFMQFTRQAFGTAMTINAGLRWCIIQDKEQVADTQPSIGAVFENTSPVVPLPDLANLERFRIIYMSEYIDAMQLMLMCSGSQNLSPTRSNVMKYSTKLNVKTGYNGTASSDIEKNGLFFGLMLTGFTDQFDMIGTARLAYTDV